MRIRLHLTHIGGPASLPLDNYPLASLIYRAVGLAAPEYATFLHNEGYTDPQTNRTFKFFVFSRPYLPGAHIQAGRLHFTPGRIEWQISSPIEEFLLLFIAGLRSQDVIVIEDLYRTTHFALDNIDMVPLPHFANSMRFTALSPLTVAVDELGTDGRHRKHFVRPDDPRFGLQVASNLIKKYRALTGNDSNDLSLKFEFDQGYIRQRGGIERVSKLVKYKGTMVKSYMAPFIVSGSTELIRLGWECGFGTSNSQGFGMAQTAPRALI